MIQHLDINRAGYFFRRKRQLTNAAINKLFVDLRAAAEEPTQNLFRAVRVTSNGTKYSAICFSFAREVSFLEPAAGAIERIFGFLMLIECRDYVALFKSGLDLPSSFKSEYLEKVGHGRVERAIATNEATFEKLRLRNMSVSRQALRSKSLEARDLENTIATTSASRFIPQGYSVKRPDGVYSATPSTGRISERSDRAGHQEMIAWAKRIITSLEADAGEVSSFIRNFARPLDLSSLNQDTEPTYVGIDVIGLAENIFDAEERVRLVRTENGQPVELDKDQVEAILESIESPLSIVDKGDKLRITAPGNPDEIGNLKVGKTRISLAALDLAEIAGISVEKCSTPLGADPDAKPLARYLDQNDLFTVLFSDLALAYINGSLFRDEALVGGGEMFLAHLQVEQSLDNADSEKGQFQANQTEFAANSVFRAVVDVIAHDDVLMCDDLGDEWADFIGLSTGTNPVMISFYHAKHGDQSLSASKFHDAVGQAIKNLGRMALPAEMTAAKLERWDDMYRNDGVQTAISRLLRGGARPDIEEKMDSVRTTPDVLQRAFIVTSSLSRNQVQQVFNDAQNGVAPPPYFVQLYWLLMSYFSACAEMGVRGYVVCRP
tara:strand:+ start:8522 stop:10339 length:1818 start_codon:yes stop_codon:yes gene_type:complete